MYAKRAGAPASRDTNMLKVENPYFDAKSKLPTNTTNLMPQQLQARGKGGDKSVTAPLGKGKGKGGLMTRPHSDGFLQDMLTPMGLHNLSDVQQYRKLVEMRNQDIMDKREDQVLREYQHVTQGLTSDTARNRMLTDTGEVKGTAVPPAPIAGQTAQQRAAQLAAHRAKNLSINATQFERRLQQVIERTTKRGKRELEVAGAQVAGKPFIPNKKAGGYMTRGAQPTGARTDGILFRQRRKKQPEDE